MPHHHGISGRTDDESSDEDSTQHHISYTDERKAAQIHGKLEAMDATHGSHGSFSMSSSLNSEPSSLEPAVNPGAKYAGLSRRRATLELDEVEDAQEVAELRTMYHRVAECLQFRHDYMAASVQRDIDNPKNLPGWKIYPPPPEPEYDPETKQFRQKSSECVSAGTIGQKFNFKECYIPGPCSESFKLESDVFAVEGNRDKIPTLKDYYKAYDHIAAISSDGPTKTFAFRRLQYLEARWNLYFLLNNEEETAKSKRIPHRDFYNVRKVDTHVHHSACMTQKHLLRFIKSKMKKCPHEVVIFRDGKLLTLRQVFETLGLTAYDLNIDTLDMHAHSDAFHRFDKFNLKYNPIGESRLREIFLKTDNFIKGRYLAEITKEVFSDLEQSKYQMAEYRISIYGRSIDEWSKLAAWVVDNKLVSDNVRWLIQVPRLYDVYYKTGLVKNFGEVVTNLFAPLFEITQNPRKDPKLHVFLQRVVGFDSVDDESKAEGRSFAKYPCPSDWNSSRNPPYSYYLYYLYANLASLNQWRKRRGFNTLVLRPHSGEAGDPEHLISAFLTSHGISHGILLRKVPFVQFLYYLDQVGIAMSPISNNALFLSYEKNPFVSYFKRGLSLSLSTDDPLQFSFTREPLIEEYSIAIQIYKLTSVDSRELALCSVIQSGFENEIKKLWGYDMHQGKVNIEKTNVPETRLAYRGETLKHERDLVSTYGFPVKFLAGFH